MKKHILSIVSFILIFALLFALIPSSFYQKWQGRYVRVEEFKKLTDEDVDVLAFGTSELWAGYDPIVTYHEQGITGYNLTVPYHSAITAYYQLCQALEYHTPKVVICDFCSLYEDNLPSENDNVSGLYYEVFDTIESPKLKMQMLKDLLKIDKNISIVSWLSPLVRYHTMWNDLGGENLVLGRDNNREDNPYRKGARLQSTYQYDGLFPIVPENWYYEEEQRDFSELSVEYYDKFIEKCQENDITVLAVFAPKLDTSSEAAARLSAEAEYFYSRGVYLLNYNTYEQVQRLNLDFERDYYDEKHLNTLGSVKFSKALANDMRLYFSIPDRRNDEKIASVWDEAYAKFEEDMLNRQPTIRYTVDLAREFGYDVLAEVAADNDNIWSGEIMRLNQEYGYGDKLRPGYYVYDNHNMNLSYYEYDGNADEVTTDTSIGSVKRVLNGDDYNIYVSLNGKGLYSEEKSYYVYTLVNPKFSTKLSVVDKNSNIRSHTCWEYDPSNGNSNKTK